MRVRHLAAAILATLAMGGHALADEPASVYNRANHLFAQGDYSGALALYDSISRQNPDLEYNRGAAHLKLGSLGKATLHFMRAQRLRPGDDDTLANLKYIETKKVDREPAEEPGAAATALEWISGLGAVAHITWMALVFYALSTIMAVALILAPPGAWRARIMLGLVIVLTATLCSGALALYRIHLFENRSLAVVMAPQAPVYPDPTSAAEPVFTLHEATIVRLGRVEGNYIFATLASGHSGWMDRASLERI
ncbi:MAG: tetratricopeptide repeat protein [Nitrospinota bacterium]|nr:tetratricopeptide repeat protein [Nitrospinota bacterium]